MKKFTNRKSWVVGLLLLAVLGCDSTDMTSAKVYLQQKNYEKAEEMLLAAFAKEPSNPEPAYLLAVEIYGRNKNWEKAADFLTKSEEIGPLFADKISQAREKYWIDNFNAGASGYNAMIKGEAVDEEKLFANTVQSFENCIVLNPEKPESYGTLAQVYIFRKDLEKGKEYMITSVEKNPKDITSLVNLGSVYYNEKKYDQALKYLIRAMEVDPSNLNAIKQIAFIYDAMGEKDQAAVAYINAINADPENSSLHFNLGVLYFNQDNWDSAISEFQRVLEISPDDKDALFNLGLIYARIENHPESEKYLEQAYELDPQSIDFVSKLKMAYYLNYGPKSKKFKEMEKIEKSLK